MLPIPEDISDVSTLSSQTTCMDIDEERKIDRRSSTHWTQAMRQELDEIQAFQRLEQLQLHDTANNEPDLAEYELSCLLESSVLDEPVPQPQLDQNPELDKDEVVQRKRQELLTEIEKYRHLNRDLETLRTQIHTTLYRHRTQTDLQMHAEIAQLKTHYESQLEQLRQECLDLGLMLKQYSDRDRFARSEQMERHRRESRETSGIVETNRQLRKQVAELKRDRDRLAERVHKADEKLDLERARFKSRIDVLQSQNHELQQHLSAYSQQALMRDDKENKRVKVPDVMDFKLPDGQVHTLNIRNQTLQISFPNQTLTLLHDRGAVQEWIYPNGTRSRIDYRRSIKSIHFPDGSREEHYGNGPTVPSVTEKKRIVKKRWEVDGRVKCAFSDGSKSIQAPGQEG